MVVPVIVLIVSPLRAIRGLSEARLGMLIVEVLIILMMFEIMTNARCPVSIQTYECCFGPIQCRSSFLELQPIHARNMRAQKKQEFWHTLRTNIIASQHRRRKDFD